MTDRDLVFALTWQRNTEPIGKAATELMRWLGTRVGRTIKARVSLSYEELIQLFERHEADLAWLPPIVFLQLQRKRLVRTLVVNERHKNQTFRAVLAVRSGSRHHTLDRLQGARAAWVDPHSTTGYVLQRLDLVGRAIDPRTTFGEERFYGSHDAAARAVLDGRSDLLGTFGIYDGDRLLRAGFSSTGVASDWRVILRGRESPSDLVAARTDLDEPTRVALRDALLASVTDPVAAPLFRELFHVEEFAPPDDVRYTALSDALDQAQRQKLFPHF